MMKEINEMFNAKNADLSQVIPIYKNYVGNANIEFRLAQKDPLGNPTTGITRRRSYLSRGGDDQAKFDLWAPDRYLNIWVIAKIGRAPASGTILAYATPPSLAAQVPYYDGVLAGAPYLTGGDKTIAHEIGHVFNLAHPWNSSGKGPGEACGDDDVDDTPPTKGHFSTCPLNDSVCANGYTVTYNYFHPDSGKVVKIEKDYPDTTNVQNVMDYSNCTVMFTKQQVMRMRAALRNLVANRNSLITTLTHQATGVGDTTNPFVRNDLRPVADFSVEKTSGASQDYNYYMCGDDTHFFSFKDRSWRDTVTSVTWSFSNGGAPIPASPSVGAQVQTKFTEAGWATITLKATGNNSGDSTVSRKDVYVANHAVINPNGFYQEFTDAAENEKWPSFNYYNNNSKWQVINTNGFYDKSCIMYNGYDTRFDAPSGSAFYTGSPAVIQQSGSSPVVKAGDIDDFFTPAFDLSGMQNECTLSFMYAGIWRTSNSAYMKDSLELAYSDDCGTSWKTFKSLTKAELANGSFGGSYVPQYMGDWSLQSIGIPADARKSKVFFRFRYKPSTDNSMYFGGTYIYLGTGNNYYIDRININPYPVGINTLVGQGQNIAVAPNPTSSNAFVVVRNTETGASDIAVTVSDMTGKVVYRTKEVLQGTIGRIEIPASAIAVKGVYMVQVVCGKETRTEKLVSH
jgi:hypothetical protein